MRGLGILASALAGGANAINQQATGDIDKQNRVDIAKEMSRIQEEASMRLAENQARLHRQGNKDALTDARDFNASPETIAAADTVAAAANARERKGLLATATDAPLNTAQREKAAADARSVAAGQRDATKDAGNDPSYLKALRGIATAQHFFGPGDALAAEQLKNLKAVGDIRKQLSNETDPEKREVLKGKEMDLLGTGLGKKDLSVALASTENAAAKARATLSDPLATEEAKASAKDSLTALQWSADNLRKQMGWRGEPAPAKEIPQGAVDFLLKNPNAASDFDSKYGAGASKQYLKDGAGAPAQPAPAKTSGGLIGFTPKPEVDPPDSPAGKQKARLDAERARQAEASAARQKEAGDAFTALASGDVEAADKLQRSSLFQYLTTDQKRQVFKTVNGRGS